MADLRISELPPLSSPDVQPGVDVLAVADISASETKKATPTALVQAALTKAGTSGGVPDGTIDPSKIKWASLLDEQIRGTSIVIGSMPGDRIKDGSITSGQVGELKSVNLEAGAVTTEKILNGAVTGEKLSDYSISDQKLAPGAAIGNIADGTLVGAKLANGSIGTQQIADSQITAEKLASGAALGNLDPLSITSGLLMTGAVTTDKVGDAQITQEKLAPGVALGNIADGSIDGEKLIDESVDGRTKLIPGTITTTQLGTESVTTEKLGEFSVTNQKLDTGCITVRNLTEGIAPPEGGLSVDASGITIANNIPAGVYAGLTYNEHGLITAVSPSGIIPSISLPVASPTEVGVVSVPTEGGLSVSGAGELTHTNQVTASSYAGIVYDDNGHIVSVTEDNKIPSSGLPVAGTTAEELGGVYIPTVGNALTVSADGAVIHSDSTVTPGVYVAVDVDAFGHVVSGSSELLQNQLPDISADKITTGEFPTDRLADGAVTGPKIADYATCLMQEDFPGKGDFLGQLWFAPSTAQLRIYGRGSGSQNLWLSVGFGNLQQNNLRWLGTYNAETDTIVTLTAIGVSSGLSAGNPFPPPTDDLSGGYFVCQTGGDNCTQPSINGITHTPGDWALCLDSAQGWVFIDASAGGGGGGGGGDMGLNDLTDVEIGGLSSPFDPTARAALQADNILRFDQNSGMWRNTAFIDGGNID